MRYVGKETREALATSKASPLELEARIIARRRDITLNIREFPEAWDWITMQFVTADYPMMEALKLAAIIANYPLEVIKTIGVRCKSTSHYTISYLAAALEREGGDEIEAIRREERYDAMIAESKSLITPLPLKRFPGVAKARLEEIEIEQQINDLLAEGDLDA